MSSHGPAAEPERGSPFDEPRLDLAAQFVAARFPGALPLEGMPPAYLLSGTTRAGESFLALQRQLAPLGLLPLLRMQDGRCVLRLVPKPPLGKWKWQTNLLLLLATLVTTFLSGYETSVFLAKSGHIGSALSGGLIFAGSLLLILGAHEMGHKLVAIRRGIDASLPYFLPMLPPFGTMGAVIITRTPAPNRDTLMDLGAAGPIAGFLAAIPVLIYGVAHSVVIMPDQLGEALSEYADPLLVRWLMGWLLHVPDGAVVLGHPAWFAGWIGLVVTSINLLPTGMLDGGHAIRAALGARAHAALAYLGVALAVALRFYLMAILMLLLMRRGHAGPLDDVTPLSRSRWLVVGILVAVFALSFTTLPVPSVVDMFRSLVR